MSANPNTEGRSELDSLLSELLDAGDPDALRRLDGLLKDNPVLQDEYVKYLSMHSLLNVEWNCLGAPLESLCEADALRFLPSLRMSSAQARRQRAETGWAASDAESPLSALARGLLRLVWFPVRAPSPLAVATVMLAALAAGAMGGVIVAYSLDRVWWRHAGADYTPQQVDAAERWLEAKRDEQGARLGHLPLASAGPWTDVKPRITASSFKNGRLVPGEIDLQPFNGAAGKGYLVALPPGHGIELLVDVESVKENALVIKRVTADGELTGHSLSFNSHDVNTQPRSSWRAGRIGYWVDFNEYDQTRYYLLCGVSKEANLTHGGKWSYSAFKPLTVSRDLMFLGWDDAAVYGTPDSSDMVFEADNDFNDVSVILHIRRPEDPDLTGKSQVLTTPERRADAVASPLPPNSYTLHVQPGQSVLVQVTCPGSGSYTLDVIDANRSERWWRHEDKGDEETFGLYSVNNRTAESLDLRFVVRQTDADADEATENGDPSGVEPAGGASKHLVHKVHARDADYCEVGFDTVEVVESDAAPQYDKVRVRLHSVQ